MIFMDIQYIVDHNLVIESMEFFYFCQYGDLMLLCEKKSLL